MAQPSTAQSANALTVLFERDPRILSRPRSAPLASLVFPLESASLDLRIDGGATFRVDRSMFALVPARVDHRLVALSAVAPTLTLLIGPKAEDLVAREYAAHFDRRAFRRILAEGRTFARTRWFDELAHRYLFERHDCGLHGSQASAFLETEITKELYFLGREVLDRSTRASAIHEEAPLIVRARAHLEARLFDAFSIRDLAQRCHCSESTMLRAFQRELDTTPITYLRHRRLDEAVLLLESGRYNVSEVALRVGYTNLPAFTVAFQKRFGVLPSRLRSATPAQRVPPQGTPSVRRLRKSL